MNPELIAYIEQNQQLYTREAIDARLIAAGYPQAEVEAAWNEVSRMRGGAGDASIPSPPPDGSAWGYEMQKPPDTKLVNKPRFWVWLLGFLALSYIVPAILILWPWGDYTVRSNMGTVALIWFGLLQLFALIAGIIVSSSRRETGMALLMGALVATVVAPLVGCVVLFGTCFGVFRA